MVFAFVSIAISSVEGSSRWALKCAIGSVCRAAQYSCTHRPTHATRARPCGFSCGFYTYMTSIRLLFCCTILYYYTILFYLHAQDGVDAHDDHHDHGRVEDARDGANDRYLGEGGIGWYRAVQGGIGWCRAKFGMPGIG